MLLEQRDVVVGLLGQFAGRLQYESHGQVTSGRLALASTPRRRGLRCERHEIGRLGNADVAFTWGKLERTISKIE